MMRLLPIWLVLAGLAMGQRYRWWSDASCTSRPNYNRLVTEAQGMACDALASLKTLTHPIPMTSVPDWDFERVFEVLFNTRVDDPTLYDSTIHHQRRFKQSTFRTPSQAVEDTLTTLCEDYKELEPGRDKKEADLLIYCDQNAGAIWQDGWYFDMENGLAGETVCNDQVIGVIQAHVWYNTLAGPPWARANPNRARLTLCDDVLQPIRLYRDGANSVRDLSQFDLGGQTRKAIRIGDWAGYVTTGVFLHEWMHAHPMLLDDVPAYDPVTYDAIPNSPYGWGNCVQKPTGVAVQNDDNYLMLITAAWLARQSRFIIQHRQFLGGYTLPRLDDVSTDEATRQFDILDGRLRFYTDISTPGNRRARFGP